MCKINEHYTAIAMWLCRDNAVSKFSLIFKYLVNLSHEWLFLSAPSISYVKGICIKRKAVCTCTAHNSYSISSVPHTYSGAILAFSRLFRFRGIFKLSFIQSFGSQFGHNNQIWRVHVFINGCFRFIKVFLVCLKCNTGLIVVESTWYIEQDCAILYTCMFRILFFR